MSTLIFWIQSEHAFRSRRLSARSTCRLYLSRHAPASALGTRQLVKQPIVLGKSNPRALVWPVGFIADSKLSMPIQVTILEVNRSSEPVEGPVRKLRAVRTRFLERLRRLIETTIRDIGPCNI